MNKYILSVLLAIFVLNLSAQVITQKTDAKTINGKIKLEEKANIDVVTMPSFDIDKLIAEDERNRNLDLPFRFGYAFDVSYNMQNSGNWHEVEEGRVWSIKIVSSGAYSINLAYDKFYLPENTQLYIYNEQKTVLQGPFTSENNTKDKTFSSDLVEGSAIILEYFEPDNVREKPEISISKIVHAYLNLFPQSTRGYGSSGSCNIDVNCPEGNNWQNESDAVAMILVGSNRICSGCMINNTNQNFTPYFLTANHCVQNQNVNNWLFRFQYKSPTCGGGDDYSYYSYYGANLEANSSVSDFALLELDNRSSSSTGITYAGWSRSTTPPSSVVGLHHPAGDVMKIATDSDQPSSALSNTHWFVDNWDKGTTEPGSSGSPLFDPNHRIIGQDHAGDGYPACDPEKGTYYGRFDVSWTHGLSTYLDPYNTGASTTNTIEIPFITGASVVCTSNSTFTLHNRPSGSTVLWTHSSNLIQLGGNTGTTYTVKAQNNYVSGNGWVKVIVNGVEFSKTFWVGKPNFILDGDEIVDVLGPGIASLVYDQNQEITNVNWTHGGAIASVTGGLIVGHFRAGSQPGFGTVYANATNCCGSNEERLIVEVIDDWYKVYPNPDILTIEIERNKLNEVIRTQEIEILLYNKLMMLQKHIKSTESKITIKVNDLKPDLYILHLKIGDKVFKDKITISYYSYIFSDLK